MYMYFVYIHVRYGMSYSTPIDTRLLSAMCPSIFVALLLI